MIRRPCYLGNDNTCTSKTFDWNVCMPWWRHQMEAFSTLLALCAGNSPVTGEFPTQKPVTRSFDVFFDMHLNKRLTKQSWGWWFETPSRPLRRHSNAKLFIDNCGVQGELRLTTSSYQHRYSYYKEKRASLPSYLYNGDPTIWIYGFYIETGTWLWLMRIYCPKLTISFG